MKQLIALEKFVLFIVAIYLFALLPYAWWLFPALLLVPDLSMLGYLVNNTVGAISYNFFHHKALGAGLYMLGLYFNQEMLLLAGVIFFAHSCFDRVFGYGLKYNDGFHHTHLGYIGKKRPQ
jgi:hypothetical protein